MYFLHMVQVVTAALTDRANFVHQEDFGDSFCHIALGGVTSPFF